MYTPFAFSQLVNKTQSKISLILRELRAVICLLEDSVSYDIFVCVCAGVSGAL